MWTVVLCIACMWPKRNTQVNCAGERFDRMEELRPTRNSRKNNLRWTLDSDGHEEPQMVMKECSLCERNFPSMAMKWTVLQKNSAREMNIASGCPRIRHLVRLYLPRLHSLSPGLKCFACWSSETVYPCTWTAMTLGERLQWFGDWWCGLWFASVDVSVFIRCVFLGTEPTVW